MMSMSGGGVKCITITNGRISFLDDRCDESQDNWASPWPATVSADLVLLSWEEFLGSEFFANWTIELIWQADGTLQGDLGIRYADGDETVGRVVLVRR